MTRDTLAGWEKWPVGALVLAAGLNTALWYAGALLPAEARQALPWLVTLAAVASVVAIDGSLIATIAGMRDGRRSWWSVGNIVVTAVFTGLAALSAHRVLPEPAGAFLHGLFAATIVTYALHLAHPRHDATVALALREQELDARDADLARREAALTRATTPIVVPDAPRGALADGGAAPRLPAPAARQKPARRATGDTEKATVLRLVASGLSASAAARQAGVKARTAQRWMREEG